SRDGVKSTAREGRQGMTLDDFRRLNFREAGSWPLAAKIVILSILAVLILAAGAFFDWKDQFESLDAAKGEETRLREQYAQKKVKAINFELYVQQLKEVEQSFGALVKACGGESHQDLRAWMAEQGKNSKGRLDPLPQIRPYEPFAYNAYDLPDPFKPRKIEPMKGSNLLAPDLARRREPLEAYPLE